jgi:hypothetical protein
MRALSPEATLTLALKLASFQVFHSMILTSEAQLADALRERLAIIADENSRRNPEQHIERLRKISEQIEKLSAALPKPINPRLAHFLARKSYEKALGVLISSRAE